MSEAVSLTAGGKTPLAEYYNDKGIWPGGASDVMGNLAGKYVSIITLMGSAVGTLGTISIEARMKGTGVNSADAFPGRVWRVALASPVPLRDSRLSRALA